MNFKDNYKNIKKETDVLFNKVKDHKLLVGRPPSKILMSCEFIVRKNIGQEIPYVDFERHCGIVRETLKRNLEVIEEILKNEAE